MKTWSYFLGFNTTLRIVVSQTLNPLSSKGGYSRIVHFDTNANTGTKSPNNHEKPGP